MGLVNELSGINYAQLESLSINFNKRVFLLKIYRISIAIIALYLFLYLLFSVALYKLIALSAFVSLLSIGCLLTKKTARLQLSAHFYIISCYCFLCFGTATSSGVENPGLLWFMICPLISFITLNSMMTRLWLFIILVTLIVFYFFEGYVVIDEFRGGKQWYLIACTLQFLMVYYIIKIFRREISKKTRELEALNELLKNNQEDLKKQQETLIHQSECLRKTEAQATERNQRLENYVNQLIDVGRMEELHAGGLEISIQSIQRILLNSMNLQNVGIWKLDDDENLNLIGSLGDFNTGFSLPQTLTRKSFPETFELLESGVIVVDNTESHQLKLQFKDMHFDTSLLACPYFIEGKFSGFFSCRARNKQWASEDVIFVRAISDTLRLAFKSHHRKSEQLLLEAKQKQIEELNDSLERKVSERTGELKIRNEQLTNFAFLNAHEIRGPICRLLGLRNLLALSKDPNEITQLSAYMASSIDELDAITQRASRLLADTLPTDYQTKD